MCLSASFVEMLSPLTVMCHAQDGSLAKTYHTGGDIYEVSWNKAGDRIAACVSSGDVAIISFRV